MGHIGTDDDAAAWLLVLSSAIKRGRRAEELEARAALARMGIAVIVDPDSPLRQPRLRIAADPGPGGA
jgi:hypothetical protein